MLVAFGEEVVVGAKPSAKRHSARQRSRLQHCLAAARVRDAKGLKTRDKRVAEQRCVWESALLNLRAKGLSRDGGKVCVRASRVGELSLRILCASSKSITFSTVAQPEREHFSRSNVACFDFLADLQLGTWGCRSRRR